MDRSEGKVKSLAGHLLVAMPQMPDPRFARSVIYLCTHSEEAGAMGLVVNVMIFVHDIKLALFLMIGIGALAGFFVVPMNALLQHRGHILMGAGHSIAVQNFNENLAILFMTGLYSILIGYGLSVHAVIVMFGCFVAGTMMLVQLKHRMNQREFDSVGQLEDVRH